MALAEKIKKMGTAEGLEETEKTHLVVCVGASGSGKTYAIDDMVAKRPDLFKKGVSCTTRDARDGEKDGIDYHFVSEERLSDMVENGEMLETNRYGGNTYGLPLSALSAKERDRHIGVILEPAGVSNLLKWNYLQGQPFIIDMVFFDLDAKQLAENMRKRGDSEEQIAKRIASDTGKDSISDSLKTIFKSGRYEFLANKEASREYYGDINERMMVVHSDLSSPAEAVVEHFEITSPPSRRLYSNYRFFKNEDERSKMHAWLESEESETYPEHKEAVQLLLSVETEQTVFTEDFEGKMAEITSFSTDSAFVVYDALFKDAQERYAGLMAAYKLLYMEESSLPNMPSFHESMSDIVRMGGAGFFRHFLYAGDGDEVDGVTLLPATMMRRDILRKFNYLGAPEGVPDALPGAVYVNGESVNRRTELFSQLDIAAGNEEMPLPYFGEYIPGTLFRTAPVMVSHGSIKMTRRKTGARVTSKDYSKKEFHLDVTTPAAMAAIIERELSFDPEAVLRIDGSESPRPFMAELAAEYSDAALRLFGYFNHSHYPAGSRLVSNELKDAAEEANVVNEIIVEAIDAAYTAVKEGAETIAASNEKLDPEVYSEELARYAIIGIAELQSVIKNCRIKSREFDNLDKQFEEQKWLVSNHDVEWPTNINEAYALVSTAIKKVLGSVVAVNLSAPMSMSEIRNITRWDEAAIAKNMVMQAGFEEVVGRRAKAIFRAVMRNQNIIDEMPELQLLKGKEAVVVQKSGRKNARVCDLKKSNVYIIDKRPEAKSRMNREAKERVKKDPEFHAMVKKLLTVPFIDFAEFDADAFKHYTVKDFTEFFDRVGKLNFHTDEAFTFKARKLGRHKASGLYYSGLKIAAIDVRAKSSFIHEVIGHHVDFTSMGMQQRGDAVAWLIMHSRIDTDYASKQKIENYYHSDVEIYARGTEVMYSLYMAGFKQVLNEARKSGELTGEHMPITQGMLAKMEENYAQHPDRIFGAFNALSDIIRNKAYLDFTAVPSDELEAVYDYFSSRFQGRSMPPAQSRKFTQSVVAANASDRENSTDGTKTKRKYIYPQGVSRGLLRKIYIAFQSKFRRTNIDYAAIGQRALLQRFDETVKGFGENADIGKAYAMEMLLEKAHGVAFRQTPSVELLPHIKALTLDELKAMTSKQQLGVVDETLTASEAQIGKEEREVSEGIYADHFAPVVPGSAKDVKPGEQPALFMFEEEEEGESAKPAASSAV